MKLEILELDDKNNKIIFKFNNVLYEIDNKTQLIFKVVNNNKKEYVDDKTIEKSVKELLKKQYNSYKKYKSSFCIALLSITGIKLLLIGTD